jgi:hypothetical protein
VTRDRHDDTDNYFGFDLAIPHPGILKLKHYGVKPRIASRHYVPQLNGTSSIYWAPFSMPRNKDYQRKFKLSFQIVNHDAAGGVLTFLGTLWQIGDDGSGKINVQYADPVEIRLI